MYIHLSVRAKNNVLGLVSVTQGTKPLEDFKPGFDTSLEYLKSCEDFTTKKTFKQLNNLDGLECNTQRELGIYLMENGFARLFPKMWDALSDNLMKPNWGTQGFTNLECMLISYMCITNDSQEFGEELLTVGCIDRILNGLGKLTEQIQSNSDKGRKLVKPILGILQNVIRLNSSHRNVYRKANGLPIVKRCLDISIKEVKTDALLVLAYIVDETESQILSEKGVVSILVDLLRYAVKSSKHVAFKSSAGYYTALELLDGLNRLAVNDDNKIVIKSNGGVPAIIRMLSDDFSDEEKQEGAKALWNLAFMKSIRHSSLQKDMIKGNPILFCYQ